MISSPWLAEMNIRIGALKDQKKVLRMILWNAYKYIYICIVMHVIHVISGESVNNHKWVIIEIAQLDQWIVKPLAG